MLCLRPKHASFPGVVGGIAGLGLCVLGLLAGGGCGTILNPALAGTLFPNSSTSLENAKGSLLIVVLNNSSSTAAARLRVTKQNGGTVDLIIPVQPFDGDSANESDRAIVVQDCDVASIQILEVLASTSTGGVQSFGSGLPPLVDGVTLSCGKVVTISIDGQAPNLLVNLEVF